MYAFDFREILVPALVALGGFVACGAVLAALLPPERQRRRGRGQLRHGLTACGSAAAKSQLR